MTNLPGLGFEEVNKNTTLTIMQILANLGLTTNLKFALDAADIGSWPGSGQKWLDLSGNGEDFMLGNSVAVAANDPTFNGVAGALSQNEYFSSDGGDYFVYDNANEAWMNTCHTNSARFTFACWVYVPDATPAALDFLFSTASFDDTIGANIQISTTGALGFVIQNGTIGAAAAYNSTAKVVVGWNFLAVSVSTGTSNGSFRRINATAETFTAGGNSSSGATNHALSLMGDTDTTTISPAPAGFRVSGMLAWDRVLTAAELLNIYDATRTRFGL